MSTCNIKKEELVFYCYGQPDSKRVEEIRNHLTACSQCAQVVRKLESTISLFKQQKLKPIPKDILDGYTREIRERLAVQEEKSPVPTLKGRDLRAWLENLFPRLHPKLVPALTVSLAVIFVFAFMRYGKINNINMVNQDIALLDTLGEDTDDIYLASDEARLADEIKNSDHIMLAQLEKETDSDDVLYNAELLEELGEELDESGDVEEDLQDMDMDDLGSNHAVG